MKKVLFIALLLFIALPVTGALANGNEIFNIEPTEQEKSLLHDYSDNFTFEIDRRIAAGENMIDKDEGTRTYIGTNNGWVRFNFKKPVNINKVYLNWTGSNNSVKRIITEGNEVIEESGLWNSGTTDVNYNKVSAIEIMLPQGYYSFYIYEIDFFGEVENINYVPITNVKTNVSYDSINLTWNNPTDDSFQSVIIKQDGKQIADLPKNIKSYPVMELEPSKQYTFELIAKYLDGTLTDPASITVTTDDLPELENVKNVTAKADYNRVDLSWELPETPTLKHVNIYRDVHEEKPFLMRLFSSSTTGATTKIFETNGTYFNDLTVEPKTTYDYRLTTTDGYTETSGVDITTTTPAAPVPEMGGVVVEPQPNGDYLYKWETPAAGQVKIIVGGEEYTTVPAEDKQLLIPAADMKYTGLGKPDVGLVPINEYGDEGTPLEPEKDLDEVELPFNVVDLLKSGVSLLLILGPFVLLSLAFILFPRLRDTIKQGFINHKERRARNGSYRNN